MGTKREKPSTKARREGYAQLHKLRRLVERLIFPEFWNKHMHSEISDPYGTSRLDRCLTFRDEFSKDGWRDFMVKYVPEHRRGGDPTIKVISKRRKRREKERKATIR